LSVESAFMAERLNLNDAWRVKQRLLVLIYSPSVLEFSGAIT
jgi:hypothetical protein